ncbi:hypothetical protein C8J57DRAFT_1247919 [Mycena rebaudengoi]|nr:hypothetical protein C8J57DRAFT_1247919 [Mycena rebaudengoi]
MDVRISVQRSNNCQSAAPESQILLDPWDSEKLPAIEKTEEDLPLEILHQVKIKFDENTARIIPEVLYLSLQLSRRKWKSDKFHIPQEAICAGLPRLIMSEIDVDVKNMAKNAHCVQGPWIGTTRRSRSTQMRDGQDLDGSDGLSIGALGILIFDASTFEQPNIKFTLLLPQDFLVSRSDEFVLSAPPLNHLQLSSLSLLRSSFFGNSFTLNHPTTFSTGRTPYSQILSVQAAALLDIVSCLLRSMDNWFLSLCVAGGDWIDSGSVTLTPRNHYPVCISTTITIESTAVLQNSEDWAYLRPMNPPSALADRQARAYECPKTYVAQIKSVPHLLFRLQVRLGRLVLLTFTKDSVLVRIGVRSSAGDSNPTERSVSLTKASSAGVQVKYDGIAAVIFHAHPQKNFKTEVMAGPR